MATWTRNQPSGGTTRRKWNLDDRTTLNNLKYHIAAEGCSEVQYDLAKQLLDETAVHDEESSSEQAVHWLLCAAQQGHDEAANLLQKCYDEGCGITADNEDDIRSCLSMTPGERAARKAARELFACLANGGKHISPRQLERKMREIYKMQKAKRQPGDSTSTSEDDMDDENLDHQPLEDVSAPVANGSINLRKHRNDKRRKPRKSHTYFQDNFVNNDRNITEENLVSAAVNYAAGRMPAVNDALTLTIPHPATLDHVPCFHRLLFHPILFLTLLYHRLINLVSDFPKHVPQSVRLTFILMIYCLVSSDNLTVLLPIGFYYLCWSFMIWSTCKMLRTKHDFIDFRIWSGLFLRYGDHNIEADISENRFLKNNMQPYLYFFCAFIGNLMIYPFISAEWLPHSEFTCVAGIFVFVSMLAFMYSSQRFPDWIVLVSFGVNVLAKYPYEMDEVVTTGWRFLDLKVPTFCSFVIGNGIEFCLNCRTALYLLIPMFLIHLAKRSNWHGTYTHLIPHCVTLSWLQLCITSAQGATMFGVVRATLGLSGILLFLPLFGLVSLLIPVFVVIEWLGFTDPNIRWGSTVIASLVALLCSCFLAINHKTQKYITVIQLFIFVTFACVLTFPYMTSNFKDTTRFNTLIPDLKHQPVISTSLPVEESHMPPPPSEYLTWQRFYTHCGSQAWWKDNNKIKTQLKCVHLEGQAVSWEGDITQVQITNVQNQLAWYINKYFPNWLNRLISCFYGERLETTFKCTDPHDQVCHDYQNILKNSHLDQRCSLHKWNTYEYEIRVKMSSGLLDKRQEVVLQAEHKFGNFTRRLVAGDRVHFYGTLSNSRRMVSWPLSQRYEEFILGSSMAHIKLVAIECLQCQDKENTPVISSTLLKSPVDARMRDLMRGLKYLLNVFLSPLITFK